MTGAGGTGAASFSGAYASALEDYTGTPASGNSGWRTSSGARR